MVALPHILCRHIFLHTPTPFPTPHSPPPSTVLDGSVTDDGELNVPCIKFVAHRHCQSTLDRFFCGDYPGSKRCISVHIGLIRIFLQAVLPFLRLFPLMEPSSQLEKNFDRRTDINDPNEPGSLREVYIEDHKIVSCSRV